MGFWTKKPGMEGSESGLASTSKPAPEIFTPQSKQEIRNLFEKKSESIIDVDAVLEKFGKVRSALGTGTVIQGKLTFDTPVRIDGRLSGEIFSSAALVVGPAGIVDATVEVSQLVVLGSVKGSVTAADRVEVYSGGTLEGTVNTPVLIIEKGCAFNGDCRMPQKEQKPAAQPAKTGPQPASQPSPKEQQGGAKLQGGTQQLSPQPSTPQPSTPQQSTGFRK